MVVFLSLGGKVAIDTGNFPENGSVNVGRGFDRFHHAALFTHLQLTAQAGGSTNITWPRKSCAWGVIPTVMTRRFQLRPLVIVGIYSVCGNHALNFSFYLIRPTLCATRTGISYRAEGGRLSRPPSWVEQIQPIAGGAQDAGVKVKLERQFGAGFQPAGLHRRRQVFRGQENSPRHRLLH